MRKLKTVSVFVTMLMAAVGSVASAEDSREDSAKVCLAAPTSKAAQETASGTWTSSSAAATVGYCTVDCSPCTLKTTECQRRGAGSCTPIQACRQASPQ